MRFGIAGEEVGELLNCAYAWVRSAPACDLRKSEIRHAGLGLDLTPSAFPLLKMSKDKGVQIREFILGFACHGSRRLAVYGSRIAVYD